MPQDSLSQTLMNRFLSRPPEQDTPDVPLPEEPQQPQGMGAQAVDGGMDFLLAALGLRGQRPGVNATGFGALAGAALPLAGAAGKALSGAQTAKSGISPILQEIFASNPDAERAYTTAMRTQLPEALKAKETAHVARYGRQADAHDALLDLSVSDRPRPIPTDTGFATAIPIGAPSSPVGAGEVPALSGARISGRSATAATNMQKLGLTEDMVRDIRTLGPKEAARKYASLNPETVYGIARGDTFNWVK